MNHSVYQLIYNSMKEGLYVFDKSGKILQINPAAQRILGYSEEEILGELGHELIHAHSKDKKVTLEECPIFLAFKKNVSYFGEEIFIAKNGEYITVEVSCTPLMKKDSFSDKYLVLFKNIGERKKLEDRLKKQVVSEIQKRTENEVFYNRIFETANLGICLTDKDGRFVVVNPAYCDIYGYKESELIGQHFTKVVPDEYKQQMTNLHDEFIKNGLDEIPREWNVVGKEDRPIHIIATAGRLDSIVGGPYKITTITDMSIAYRTQKLQKEQEILLIQQSKLAAIGEMLGAIAHQWRQPLNIINCTTLDLRLKKEMGNLNDEELNNSIKELNQMTGVMSKTVDDFMNFFKPSKTKGYFLLHKSVEYAIDILRAQLKNHGISIIFEVDENIKIYGASGELEQVILNLITNARDAYDDQNKETKPIAIYSKSKPNHIELIVEDEAGGVPKENLDTIFEPYFTTKGDSQGTGIGLYMCEIIMKKTFNGDIKIMNYNSSLGEKGLRMVLRFPKKGDNSESN